MLYFYILIGFNHDRYKTPEKDRFLATSSELETLLTTCVLFLEEKCGGFIVYDDLFTAFYGECAHGRVEWENVKIPLAVKHEMTPGKMNFLFQGYIYLETLPH